MIEYKPKITEEPSEETIKRRKERKKKIEEGLISIKKWCQLCRYPECGDQQYEGDNANCNVGIDEYYLRNHDIPDWAKEVYHVAHSIEEMKEYFDTHHGEQKKYEKVCDSCLDSFVTNDMTNILCQTCIDDYNNDAKKEKEIYFQLLSKKEKELEDMKAIFQEKYGFLDVELPIDDEDEESGCIADKIDEINDLRRDQKKM